MKSHMADADAHPPSNQRVDSEHARAEPRAAVAWGSARGMGGDLPMLLTVNEVAALLRVPNSWVYDHVRPGCRDPLPHIKLSKYLRFRASDIDAYIESIAKNGRRG